MIAKCFHENYFLSCSKYLRANRGDEVDDVVRMRMVVVLVKAVVVVRMLEVMVVVMMEAEVITMVVVVKTVMLVGMVVIRRAVVMRMVMVMVLGQRWQY